MKPKLSIIVPVYNMEKFLHRCIDSILSQTFNAYEIICVNDGSTDGSQDILEEYARKDARIHILTKPNGGLVSARKAGVAIAGGEYIGFVDSDDWIEPEMFDRLYAIAKRYSVDIVTSGYYQEGNYVSVSYDTVNTGLYEKETIRELRNHFFFNFDKKDRGIIASLCTKIMKAKILKKVLPMILDNITMGEDKMTTLSFLLHCDSAFILPEAYYHYIMTPSSMTHSADTQYLIRVNYVYQYLRSLYTHPNFSKQMRIQAELYITQFLLKGINTWMGFLNRNLLWIDPYWLNEIPAGSRIVLYGAGDLGRKYYQQLTAYGKHNFIGCIDFGYKKMKGYPFEVLSPKCLRELEYDYVIITIKDPKTKNKTFDNLTALGIAEKDILWFPQDEMFWRFAEADGLLTGRTCIDEEI